MSEHVFVVSEWLAKDGKEEQLWQVLHHIMEQTLKEPGCIKAHATKQIEHPGSPTKSKYQIVLLQEYKTLADFDFHCAQDYLNDAFKIYVEDQQTSIVEDWRCRLFAEPS